MTKVRAGGIEGLRQVHARLRRDLGELEAAAGAPAGEGPEDLGARLCRTRAHLAEHFRFEEENGYMSAVLLRDPNRARQIEQLLDEHRRLCAALESLVEEAGQAVTEALRTKVPQWVASVRRHEEREDTLVQDVFNVDTGAED
jgi:hypothetical protein